MPSAPGAPALILFDIDGTLMRRSGPHHRQALVDAVRAITGLPSTTDNIPVQGMLDRDILAWMLRDAGYPSSGIPTVMPHLVTRAQWLYSRSCPRDLSDKLCPGVLPLLRALRARRAPTGLVTGNLTRIGWKKVERARIKRFFQFGAFAETGRTRADLVKLAIAHARRAGWLRASTPITLIGDHPNDILAAKQNSIRSIAVATGLVSRDELAAHRPNLALDTLEALDPEFLLQ